MRAGGMGPVRGGGKGLPHPPQGCPRPRAARCSWERVGKTGSFPRQRAGPGWAWGGLEGGTPAPQVSGWGSTVGPHSGTAGKGRGSPAPPVRDTPTPAAPRRGCTPIRRGSVWREEAEGVQPPGAGPGVRGGRDVRGVGLLPRLFRCWNIPGAARAACGDARSWQGPSCSASPPPAPVPHPVQDAAPRLPHNPHGPFKYSANSK